MKIINGLGNVERVDSLLELEDLVELTSHGFRSVRIGTVEAVAARLRADQGERRPCGEAVCDAAVACRVPGQHDEVPVVPLSESDGLFLRSLHIEAPENDGER